ncbi:MAG: NAD(P)H-dependent oxidoreductase [Candidatus Colwellbacteria bacterium]|nr:NAD(P)H-dependent oxidoreductase [Candidatus Colwellbacteria bacterium]
MYIPIILGTGREGRASEKVAKFVSDQLSLSGNITEIIDVRDHGARATWEPSPMTVEYKRKIKEADGVIVVSPEYNHGYPGELKMLLDSAYDEYFGKPMGICGVSIGILGGARMIEQLRLVSIELHMIPMREAVMFSNVGKLFDDKGAIIDPSYGDRLKKLIDEIMSRAPKKQAV